MPKTSSPKFTIGSDPEMILVDGAGRLIRAGDVLRKTDKFGVDGHAYIAELRPEPAVHPQKFIENLQKLFRTKTDKLEKYRWLAGPWVHNKPLGGHIHFGVPKKDNYIDALDNLLGNVLALTEPEELARERRTVVFYGDKPYGCLSDFRDKKWGFEYRTPSSFIVNPGVSLGIMSLAKAIIHEELLGSSSAWTKLPAKTRAALKFKKEDFYACNKKIFIPHIPLLWEVFKSMRYFSENYEGKDMWGAVAYLRNKVVESLGYNVNRDIKLSWRLLPENKPTPKTTAEYTPLVLDDFDFGQLPPRTPTLIEFVTQLRTTYATI